MANLGKATYTIDLDARKFNQGIDDAKGKAGGLSGALGKIGSIGAGAAAAGLAAAGTAVVALGRAAIKSALELEQVHATFTTFLGSKDAASAFTDEMKELAASTPLAFNEVAQGAQTLLAFGFEANTVSDRMRTLGDLALGNAEKFGRLTIAYGQVKASGQLYAEELNQFIEAGVPLIGALSEHLGVAENQVKKLASEGEVDFADLEAALAKLTSEGGLFEGAMDDLADTVQGRLNRGISDMNQALGHLGQAITPLLGSLAEHMSRLAENIQNIDPSVIKTLGDHINYAWQEVVKFDRDAQGFTDSILDPIRKALGLKTVGQILAEQSAALRKLQEELKPTKFHFDELGDAVDSVGAVLSEYEQAQLAAARAQDAAARAAEEEGDAVEELSADIVKLIEKWRELEGQAKTFTGAIYEQVDKWVQLETAQRNYDAAVMEGAPLDRIAEMGLKIEKLKEELGVTKQLTEAVQELTQAEIDKLAQTQVVDQRQLQTGLGGGTPETENLGDQLDEEKKAKIDEFNKALTNTKNLIGQSSSLFGNFFQIARQGYKTIINEIKALEDEEKTLQKVLKEGSEAEKAAAKARLDEIKKEKEAKKKAAREQYQRMKALFEFQKAAALAQAWINTYEAVTKAWAQGGIFGAIGAAIAFAAGVAQTILISNRKPPPPPKFAEGGIVTRPMMGIVGEAGPEAIIPLSKADMVMGRDVTVNIENAYGTPTEDLITMIRDGINRQERDETG